MEDTFDAPDQHPEGSRVSLTLKPEERETAERLVEMALAEDLGTVGDIDFPVAHPGRHAGLRQRRRED